MNSALAAQNWAAPIQANCREIFFVCYTWEQWTRPMPRKRFSAAKKSPPMPPDFNRDEDGLPLVPLGDVEDVDELLDEMDEDVVRRVDEMWGRLGIK